MTTTAIQVTDIDSLARVAKMAHGSGLARVQSVEAAGVVIMAGLELGLTPMELPRERFATFLQTESVRWKAAVDAAGAAKTME